jgi:arylsulfatase A-like enzyme
MKQFISNSNLGLLSSTFMLGGCTPVQSPSESVRQPNIIFVVSDDHSAPFLGCYGDPNVKTPNIDRLAKEGILFRNAYTTAPQSVPSRASLMTGRSVVDVRMTRFSAPLPADIISYPELLRTTGYYTGICGRTFHLDGSHVPPETETVFQEYSLRTFENRVAAHTSGIINEKLHENAAISKRMKKKNRNNNGR